MRTISLEIGGKTRKLRFGSSAAQAAADDFNRAHPWQLVTHTVASVANLANEGGDLGAIQVLLRHSILGDNGLPDKNLTPEKVYGWIDAHILPVEEGGPGGSLTYFSNPLMQALVASGAIKAEAIRTPEEGTTDDKRPPLTVVAKTTEGTSSPGE